MGVLGYLMGVLGYLMGVLGYLINGRSRISHGLAAAPGHGQVALGAKKVARTWTGARNGGPAPFSSPHCDAASSCS